MSTQPLARKPAAHPLRVAALALAALLVMGASTASAQSADDDATLSLNRLELAREIVDREPQDTEAPYLADGERLYVFIDVHNPDGPERELSVVWHHLDREWQHTQTIEAGQSRRWRTWVTHRLSERTVGQWEVEVLGPDGQLLGSLDFVVEPLPSETGLSAALENES